MKQEEIWHGISQLFFLNNWCGVRDFRAERIKQLLDGIRSKIFTRNRMKVNLTAETRALPALIKRTEQLISALPKGSKPAAENFSPEIICTGESLLVPSRVAFIAAALPGAGYGTVEHTCQILLSHLLRTGFLWEEIRMKGGAYGASANNSGLEKIFTLTSYRDPNVARTLNSFAKNCFLP